MKIFNILFVLFIFFFFSCDDNIVEPDAIPMTIETMLETPGYTWINETLINYNPDPNIYSQIYSLIDSNKDKFVIFARAACSCPDDKKEFAQVAKILLKLEEDKKISKNNWEIYAMSSRTNPNPYSNIVKLNNLPEIVHFRNGKPNYYFIDTLKFVILNSLKYPVKAEELFLEALKKP